MADHSDQAARHVSLCLADAGLKLHLGLSSLLGHTLLHALAWWVLALDYLAPVAPVAAGELHLDAIVRRSWPHCGRINHNIALMPLRKAGDALAATSSCHHPLLPLLSQDAVTAPCCTRRSVCCGGHIVRPWRCLCGRCRRPLHADGASAGRVCGHEPAAAAALAVLGSLLGLAERQGQVSA